MNDIQAPKTLVLTATTTVSEFIPDRVIHSALNESCCDADRLAFIESFLVPAAIEWCEAYIRKSVYSRVWVWQFELPDTDLSFYLPKDPVSALSTFQVVDAEGARTDVTEFTRFGALIQPSCGNAWPCESCSFFEIVFTTGMAEVPLAFSMAAVQLALFWDLNRLGETPPKGITQILDSLKKRVAV